MTDERRGGVESIEPDPELQTVEAAPGRSYAVNRVAELYEIRAVVVEDPPGRYRLNPDITAFAGAVFERALSRRQDDRIRHALLAALASLPADHLRVIQELCAPPPLESAVQGVEVDDPDGFVSAVKTAARSHGISEPPVEASARTVRATNPPDHLVGAMLDRLKRESDQRKLDQLASFLAILAPGQIALLRHLTGVGRVDEGTLRRLDPEGDLINEQASRSGFTASTGLSVRSVATTRTSGRCSRSSATSWDSSGGRPLRDQPQRQRTDRLQLSPAKSRMS